jgi:hydrogenase expression/formation protein HypC
VSKEINLSFVPEVKKGDYVLVHAGFALNTVDEAEAKRIFEYLREMDELDLRETDETSGLEESGP